MPILLMIIAMLLGGCGNPKEEIPPESTMESEPLYDQIRVTYAEVNAQFSFVREADCTGTAYATYYFEPTLDPAVRVACMEATDCILANSGMAGEKPEIHIFPRDFFDGVNVVENALYAGTDNWQSEVWATNVILAAYGDCCHYGLAYGYAAILCERLGWETPRSATGCAPEDPEVYDLNLLCFDEDFVSEGDISAAKLTACQAATYLVETQGEENLRHLLAGSRTGAGMEVLAEKLGEYYAAQGIDHSPGLLRFGYGGISCDYMLKSEFGTFYMGKDWMDANTTSNPLVSSGFLHRDYGETREFFERNIQQMQLYQELFDLGNYDNGLTILFPNSRKGSQYSCYQSGLHRILVYNVDSMMHEYIHALTKPVTSQPLWETEGFARYFSYLYDYYGTAFLNEDYNTAEESPATAYLFEFRQTIDRPIDIAVDFRELENIAVYSRNYTDPNAGYVAGSSFIQYLVGMYGEKNVAKWIYGEGETFPKSCQELVDEWNRYIDTNYSAFSRYSG